MNNKEVNGSQSLIVLGIAGGIADGYFVKHFLNWEWGIVVGFLAGLLVSFLIASLTGKLPKPPMKFAPGKFRNILVMAFVYIATIFVVIIFLENGLASPWNLVIAAATLIPGFGLVIVFLDAIFSLDELQSKIMTQGITFAFFSSLIVFFTLGILELAGLESIPMIFIPLIMAFFMAVGKLITMRRY
jgi:MFS family permease